MPRTPAFYFLKKISLGYVPDVVKMILLALTPAFVFLVFYGTEQEECIKPVGCMWRYDGGLKEKLPSDGVTNWTTCTFHGTPFLLEGTTDKQTMIIWTWVSGRHFLENELSEHVTSRKTT